MLPLDDDFCKTNSSKNYQFFEIIERHFLKSMQARNSLQTRCSLLGTHILATIACKLHHEDVHLKMPFPYPNDAPSNPLILQKHSLLWWCSILQPMQMFFQSQLVFSIHIPLWLTLLCIILLLHLFLGISCRSICM